MCSIDERLALDEIIGRLVTDAHLNQIAVVHVCQN